MINARYDTLLTPLSIDISTGDTITSNAVTFTEMFSENNSFELWTYNIEKVLAEKAETNELRVMWDKYCIFVNI